MARVNKIEVVDKGGEIELRQRKPLVGRSGYAVGWRLTIPKGAGGVDRQALERALTDLGTPTPQR